MDGEVELLGERIAEQAAHLSAATHRLLADLREFDIKGGWFKQGARSCAHWLSWRVGWDLVTAREHVLVARRLGEHAAIDDALRRGEISYSKARAIVRVATPANEAMLLETARFSTGAELAKLSRKYATIQAHCDGDAPRDDLQRRYVRKRDTHDGMVKIEAVLHAEEAEIVWAMLDDAAKRLIRTSASYSVGDSAGPTASVNAEEYSNNDAAASCSLASGSDAAALCVAASISSPFLNVDAAASCRIPSDDEVETTVLIVVDREVDDAAASLGSSAESWDGTGVGREAAPMPVLAKSVRSANVLQQREDATRRAFNRADALMAIAQACLRGDRPNRSPIDVTVTIPLSDLRAGAVDPTDVGCMGSSCISPEAARRISCDSSVIEVVEDDQGMPLSVGRKRRTIAGSIKRALLKRDTMCTFPGCTYSLYLEGHHIRHWADGGETSLDNGLLLCSLHHRFVHEYGYQIELGDNHRPEFRDPHGRLVPAVPKPPAAPQGSLRRS